jgi:TRAP-type C4-dicarboxylate transport system permease small subunit
LAGALPRPARLWLARLVLLVVAVVAGAGAWHAGALLRFSVEMEQYTDSTLGLPMWLLQAPLVVGLDLAGLQALATLLRSFVEPGRLSESGEPASV